MKPSKLKRATVVASLGAVLAGIAASIVQIISDASSMSAGPEQKIEGSNNVVGDGNAVHIDNRTTTINNPPRSAGESLDDRRKNLLYGTWASDYRYGDKPEELRLRGEMSYLRNGMYRYVGEIDIPMQCPMGSCVHHMYIQSTGRWSLHGSHISMENVETRTLPRRVTINAVVHDAATVVTQHVPASDVGLQSGATTDYKIVALADSSMTVEAQDLKGRPFSFTAVKRPGSGD